MAPLVVIRSGSKEVEYRDPRAGWKRTVAALLREGDELHQGDQHSGSSEDDDDSSDDDDEDDAEPDEEETKQQQQENIEAPSSIYYGMSSELLALNGMRVFRCVECANTVADRDDVIAKSFFGRTGKAYLMTAMFNVRMGTHRNRYLMTGMHTICDVICNRCDVVLGWKYIRAMEPSQQYKEGKFIMERAVVQDEADEITWQRQ